MEFWLLGFVHGLDWTERLAAAMLALTTFPFGHMFLILLICLQGSRLLEIRRGQKALDQPVGTQTKVPDVHI